MQLNHLCPVLRARRAAPLYLACLVAICLATGCTTSLREYVSNGFKVGPNYCRPAVPVAEEWIDSENPQLVSAPDDHATWWQQFNDPALDALVHSAYEQNITVREAGFRVIEARALRRVAAGNLFPQSQQAIGSYTRQQISRELGFAPGGSGGGAGIGIGRSFDIYRLGGSMAWELDFWGRFRRAVEQADARLDATVEDYDDVLVLLVADVASTYVEIRTLQQRIIYARANVGSQRGSLQIASDLFEGGNTGKLDVSQAQTNLSQTEALIPQLELQLRQAENQLCVLMGQPPQDVSRFLDLSPTRIPTAPPEIVVGIPAELVRRRPDVRRAERLVAAQSAQIGITAANMYPAFSIAGQLTVESRDLSDLFKSSAVAGSVGPSFNWNLLQYGRLRNNVYAQEAYFEQLVAQYQQTVLEANREAEDALVSYLKSQERATALVQGVGAAVESRDLVNELYRGGRTDFGRVFVAELALVNQQDLLASAQGDIALSLVEVYRSLGGGWQIRLANPQRLPSVLPPAVIIEGVPTPVPTPAPVTPPAGDATGAGPMLVPLACQ